MEVIAPIRSRTALRPDLHVHTQGSDGILTPSEVMRRAARHGVNLISVTDHDTTIALEEAANAAKAFGIDFIPGVEVSTAGDDEVHMLGYFVTPHMPALAALLAGFRQDKQRRCEECLDRLQKKGMPLSMDDLQLPAGVVGSRPMIARAMVRKGYVLSVPDAFRRYLAVGMPAYVPRQVIDPGVAIQILRREGAVPVLAHPGLLAYAEATLIKKIDEWVLQGLMGIEAYHPAHSPAACRFWADVAHQRGLLVTGGSDFHDGLPPHGELGQMIDRWKTAHEDTMRLLDCFDQGVAV